MTQADVVQHWRRGAQESLQLAHAALDMGSYTLALFHCHLAIEKALKASYIERFDHEHPYVHDLLGIALLLREDWDDDAKRLFASLTDYAIAARYSDPAWAEKEATKENAKKWIDATGHFLTSLL